jgi:gluconolactonase
MKRPPSSSLVWAALFAITGCGSESKPSRPMSPDAASKRDASVSATKLDSGSTSSGSDGAAPADAAVTMDTAAPGPDGGSADLRASNEAGPPPAGACVTGNAPAAPAPGAINPRTGLTVSAAALVTFATPSAADGVAWRSSEGALYVASPREGGDVGKVYKVVPPATTPTAVREDARGTWGVTFTADNLMLNAETLTGKITRATAGGAVEPVAETYMGMNLNAPNDVVARADGNVYFTDKGKNWGMARTATIPFNGVYRVSPQGAVSLVTSTLTAPEGVALSKDGKQLYVIDEEKGLYRFALSDDGRPYCGDPQATLWKGPGRTSPEIHRATGLCIDDENNIFVAAYYQNSKTGFSIFKPDGTDAGWIETGTSQTRNRDCTFGGADRKTLYFTRGDAVYSIATNIAGSPN